MSKININIFKTNKLVLNIVVGSDMTWIKIKKIDLNKLWFVFTFILTDAN